MDIYFSIIIPVYNVEKYIRKCLSSVVNQTFDNYEVIVICDKSTDKSEKIVDQFIKENKRIKKYIYKNSGLAEAKNMGVSKAIGKYLVFLDGDDYLETNYLEFLAHNIKECDDITRIQARTVNDNYELIEEYNERPFTSLNSLEAFKIIKTYHFIENSWLYIYKNSFWKQNKFKFTKGCIAEDYGLTPLIISKSKSISSLNYVGYSYVQRPNSLMSDNNVEKRLNKFYDMLKQRNNLLRDLSYKNDYDIIQFLNYSLIYYSTTFDKKQYKKLKKILIYNKVFNTMERKTLKQIIKSFIVRYFTLFYYNVIVRRYE